MHFNILCGPSWYGLFLHLFLAFVQVPPYLDFLHTEILVTFQIPCIYLNLISFECFWQWKHIPLSSLKWKSLFVSLDLAQDVTTLYHFPDVSFSLFCLVHFPLKFLLIVVMTTLYISLKYYSCLENPMDREAW